MTTSRNSGNSLADGRIDDHIKSFSAGTQDLVKKWHDGSATTKEVFQSVISDPGKHEE